MGSHGWPRTCALGRWNKAKGRVNTWRASNVGGSTPEKTLMCNRKGGTLLVMNINAMRTGRSANPVEIRVRGALVRPVPTRNRQRKLRYGLIHEVAKLRLYALSIATVMSIVSWFMDVSFAAAQRECCVVFACHPGSSQYAQSGIAHLTSHLRGAKCRPKTPAEPPRWGRDANPRGYSEVLSAEYSHVYKVMRK